MRDTEAFIVLMETNEKKMSPLVMVQFIHWQSLNTTANGLLKWVMMACIK